MEHIPFYFGKSSDNKDIILIAFIRHPNVTLRKERRNKGRVVKENKLSLVKVLYKIVNPSVASLTFIGLTLDFWLPSINFDRVLRAQLPLDLVDP